MTTVHDTGQRATQTSHAPTANPPSQRPKRRHPRSRWRRAAQFALRFWLLPLQVYAVGLLVSFGITVARDDGSTLLQRLVGAWQTVIADIGNASQILLLQPLYAVARPYPLAAVVPAVLMLFALLIALDWWAAADRRRDRQAFPRARRTKPSPAQWVDVATEQKFLGDRPPRMVAEERLSRDGSPDAGMIADLLGYGELVDVLYRLILASAEEAPFAVSFEAEWGMGKTTAMQMLRERLRQASFTIGSREWQCVTVWFNAWKYRGADVQRGLIASVFDTIDRRSLKWLLSSRGRRHVLGLGVELLLSIFRQGDAGRQILARLDASASFRNQFEEEFKRLRDHWREMLGREPLLLIFIDDLDRCSSTNVASTLETMKLFFDAPGCIFVLGFDPTIVAAAIQRDSSGLIKDGAAYLKKLFLFNYSLQRPTDSALREFIETQAAQVGLSKILQARVAGYGELILRGTGGNPREIIRFLNALTVTSQVLRSQLNDDSDYKSLCLLLLLWVRWPGVYREMARAAQDEKLGDMVDALYGLLQIQTSAP